MHLYIKLNFGTLYYHFERLAEQGLIEAVGVERGEHRPERTIYRVTAAGREWFRGDLLGHLATLQQPYFPVDAALPFLRFADPERVEGAFRTRLAALERLHHELCAIREAAPRCLDRGVDAVIRHGLALMNAELGWLREMIAEIESGDFFPTDRAACGGDVALEDSAAAHETLLAAVARYEAVAKKLVR